MQKNLENVKGFPTRSMLDEVPAKVKYYKMKTRRLSTLKII